jgi:hypothetical protein
VGEGERGEKEREVENFETITAPYRKFHLFELKM